MAYIPKSQIKENQFTSGAEWYYVKNQASYTGFYYILSNGKAYTGKNPNDPPNEEIIKKAIKTTSAEYKKNSDVDDGSNSVEYADNWDDFTYQDQRQKAKDVQIYGILTDTDYELIRSKPLYDPTFPTPEDYEKGMFVRYFVCKINQLEYLEVNKETYDNIYTQNKVWVWEDYVPFTLDWYINGDIDRVFNNNKGSIFIKEREINKKGLEDYLGKQYLEYFKYKEASNLSTRGGELITPTGQDYVGPYHIHEFQGPMEGATHTSKAHKKLFYKRFYRGQMVDSLNQEGVIETGETQAISFSTVISTDPNYNPSSFSSSPSMGGSSGYTPPSTPSRPPSRGPREGGGGRENRGGY